MDLGSKYIRDGFLGWCFAYIRHPVIVSPLVRCVLRRLVSNNIGCFKKKET